MHCRGKVVKLDRGFPLVRDDSGKEYRCKHATALVKGAKQRAVVGDEVEIEMGDNADMAQIARILPRRNKLVRKDPAERALPQVMAANFDTVIIAHPLADLNIRRLERELVLAFETGARVVVALTKADLAGGDLAGKQADQVRSIVSSDVPVVVVSAEEAAGAERLRTFIPSGSVAVLIGRSGVGKSSLVNLLAGGHVQQTTPVRESDGKGRHTTVSREMVPIEGGGIVVDMPGVRGLGLWESQGGIEAAFPDIVALSEECRFRDCSHKNEPGCAVLEAVQKGELRAERLESYQRLMDESGAQDQRNVEAQRLLTRTGHPRRRS